MHGGNDAVNESRQTPEVAAQAAQVDRCDRPAELREMETQLVQEHDLRVHVFVAATPRSVPARVSSVASASRAAWLLAMFVTATTVAPRARARRSAASVSAVSPNWVTPRTSVRRSTIGSRYRNSEATATSTGTRAQRSIANLPAEAGVV